MSVNYLVIGSVALVVILVLFFAVYKNQKEKIKLEDTLNKGELKTENHHEGDGQ